jgi:hypothetical protein
MHCIYKWLETHDDCPLDRVKWAEKISNVVEGGINNGAFAGN